MRKGKRGPIIKGSAARGRSSQETKPKPNGSMGHGSNHQTTSIKLNGSRAKKSSHQTPSSKFNGSGGQRSSHQSPLGKPEGSRGKGGRAAQNQRIYRQVAQALTRLLAAHASKQGGASIKSLTLAPSNVAKKATHALTCQTLRYLPVLQAVLAAAGVLAPDSSRSGGGSTREGKGLERGHGKGTTAEASSNGRAAQVPCKKGGRQVWPELAYVVTYDLLFGQKQAASAAAGGVGPAGQQQGKEGASAAVLRAVTSRRSALQAELARLVVREGVASAEELVAKMGGTPQSKSGTSGAERQGDQQLLQQDLVFPRYARVNTLKASLQEVELKLSVGGGFKAKPGRSGEQQEAPADAVQKKGKREDEGLGEECEPGESSGLSFDADAEAGPDGLEKQTPSDGGSGKAKGADGKNLGAERASSVEFECDELIPNVLRFPAGTDLHAHPLVQSGKLVLQGRASCIPAAVLAPQSGSHVVDACAAPGNKTTHLAAIMGGTGKIWACERDPRRAVTLAETVARAGATGIVEVVQGDFLKVDTASRKFAKVSAVLVDPSCSGSGTTVSRMDHLLPSSRGKLPGNPSRSKGGGKRKRGDLDGEEHGAKDRSEADLNGKADDRDAANVDEATDDAGATARIERLARFQEAALRHALTFPAAERVVYSTCSVHVRENEGVVQRVLPRATELGFELVKALPAWQRRGLPEFPFAELVLRTNPAEDQMEGFFVALFVRKKGHRKGPLSPISAHEKGPIAPVAAREGGTETWDGGMNGGPTLPSEALNDAQVEQEGRYHGAAGGGRPKQRSETKRKKRKVAHEFSFISHQGQKTA